MLGPRRFFKGAAFALVILLMVAIFFERNEDTPRETEVSSSEQGNTNPRILPESDLRTEEGLSNPLSFDQEPERYGLLPALRSGEEVIRHFAYDVVYNEMHEQAQWVAYTLTPERLVKRCSRTDNFRSDPLVRTGTADVADYRGSGYDRGHLVPAGDMVWSTTAISESFFFSNISPQNPSFNRGIWKTLEELTRTWAADSDSLYIVTGPLLSDELPTLGRNEVSIPEAYFKAILRFDGGQMKGVGFVLPNRRSTLPLRSYALSIDSVEALTGIDFFAGFPDDIEDQVERVLCSLCWTWTPNRNVYQYEESSSQGNSRRSSTSVQCSGTTKKGRRCRNRTRNVSGYCYHHVSQQ